jgi:hypothetical protein
MMTYGWLLVGLAAAVSALMAVAVTPSAFALVQTSLAALPLFLLGLSLGSYMAMAAGVAASVALLLALGVEPALAFAATNAAPAMLMVWVAERTRSGATAIALAMTGYAAGMIVLGSLIFAGVEDGFQGAVRSVVTDAFDQLTAYLVSVSPEPVDTAGLEQMAAVLERFLPGMLACAWFMTIGLNAAIAQTVLRQFDKAALPTADIAMLSVPRWMSIALFGLLVTAYLPGGIGYVGTNVVMVVLMLFFLSGLGAIHAIARPNPNGSVWLAGVYVLLLLFNWVAASVVVLVGMLDMVFEFRRRAGSPPDDE